MHEQPSSIPAAVIAQRYSERPGCRFVGCREVGIPVFLMDLRACVVETRELPTVDEFLLRTLALGISLIDELTSILGLPRAFVDHRLANLRRLEFIDVTQTASDLRIRLTETGKAAAHELSVRELREVTLKAVAVHGWTRKPLPLQESLLLPPKEADDRGLVQLRPIPARHPTADEIDVRAISKHAKIAARRRTGSPSSNSPSIEVLGIRAVLKGVRTRFLPAILLQFETIGLTHQKQVAFAVDGVLDESLERAFADVKGLTVFGDILADEPISADDLVAEHVPAELQASVRSRLLSDRDTKVLTALETELAVERIQPDESGKPDTRHIQAAKIKELEAKINGLEATAGDRPRVVPTAKCRDVFLRSLQEAKVRFMVVSAFIGADVVNDWFVSLVDKAVRRGVQVYIVYGQSDEERMKRRSWQEAEQRLRALEARHKGSVHLQIGDTHAKMLVCDDHLAMCGSFNFLSYRGEGRKVRDEKAMLMTHRDDVAGVAQDILDRFS